MKENHDENLENNNKNETYFKKISELFAIDIIDKNDFNEFMNYKIFKLKEQYFNKTNVKKILWKFLYQQIPVQICTYKNSYQIIDFFHRSPLKLTQKFEIYIQKFEPGICDYFKKLEFEPINPI